jgi:hypothetical protein
MIAGEREVFAQRIVAGALFANGFERGGTGAWSLVAGVLGHPVRSPAGLD